MYAYTTYIVGYVMYSEISQCLEWFKTYPYFQGIELVCVSMAQTHPLHKATLLWSSIVVVVLNR